MFSHILLTEDNLKIGIKNTLLSILTAGIRHISFMLNCALRAKESPTSAYFKLQRIKYHQ